MRTERFVLDKLAGRWDWRLFTANNKLIAISPITYTTRRSACRAARTVANIAQDAPYYWSD